jgi:tRNA A-37 threonylcarbamoyl transferase component Bud32
MSTCPRCGSSLEKPGEPCPRCLLELGRTPPEPAPPASSASAPRARRRADPPIEELAKRFPELEISARIGAGGMGAVYKARQPRIDRWVALKILSLDPADDPTFAERFRREAVVLARLDHPNVVKLYDFGERDGLFYLLLEFVDGPNLRTLMKQGLLEPKQALGVVPQMCEALQFAHDEGIVHRDIKPENVLLDAKGRVKIADFGLAKLVDADARDVSLTEVDQIVGTPHYMAPEQIRGSREVDHRADIYSLGVVFYEMLTGELPRGNFELPSRRVHVDVRLDEIVLKSLERAPERRYQHAVEVKTDVESVGTEPTEHSRTYEQKPVLLAGISIRRRKRAHEGKKIAVHPSKPWEFFVTHLLLWPLAALAWNGGAWPFFFAMAFIAAMIWSHIQLAVHAQPELEAMLTAEPKTWKVVRTLATLALLGGGLFTLVAGQVSLFPFLSTTYRSGPSDPASMRALKTQLLPRLEERTRVPLAATIAAAGDTVREEGVFVLDAEDAWRSPFLVLLAPILLFGAAWAASDPLNGKRPARWWTMPTLATVAPIGALAVLELGSALFTAARVETGPLVPLVDGQVTALAGEKRVEERSRDLRIALLRQDYRVTAQGSWSFGDRRPPSTSGDLQVLFAEPSSPLDRWRMTWRGPKRKDPHAVFVLLGRVDEEGRAVSTVLGFDLGDAPVGSQDRVRAAEWLGRTLASLQG